MATTTAIKNKKDCKKNISKNNYCKIVPNLLLNYTYALNLTHTKFVCIGFDASTFEEKIILNDTHNGYIELNCLDWYSIFLKLQKINKFVHQMVTTEASCKIQNKIIVSNRINLQIIKDNNECIYVAISKNHNDQRQIIVLNYLEYTNLYTLSEYLHMIVSYNRTASSLISAYFERYVKKCVELNTTVLMPQHFFTPDNYIGHNILNYSRLFYEFSFLCLLKIYNAIEHVKNHI